MLYIHKLTDLNMRSAETESLSILREIKQKFTLPLSYPKFSQFFSELNIQDINLDLIQKGLDVIEQTTNNLMIIYSSRNSQIELINVERSIKILITTKQYLSNNLTYAKLLKENLESNLNKLNLTLNLIPSAKTPEARIALNDEISNVFEFILRNKQFFFNCTDIVEEGALNSIKGLNESIDQGFLYHLEIEETLKKINPYELKTKVPAELSQAVDIVRENVAIINQATQKAYDINKKMVDLSVFLYTFVKFANGK